MKVLAKFTLLHFIFRKETDKLEKGKAIREATKRVNLGPDSLPSICFYTLLNSGQTVLCADICDDSSLLAVGFNNSTIKVIMIIILNSISFYLSCCSAKYVYI